MNNDLLKKAVRNALLASAAATLVLPVAYAAEDDAQEEEDRIVVTGSRLKRSDVEGANPITVISREQIELSGETSAAELLRNTTFNSTGSFRPQSGSSAQGVSLVSLRGLGSGRSLVLIDGRRLTPSPSTGQGQDLNSIPIGAIERIEILTDGASAIYGSDAIGGVVNVITRKDFNGAELSYGIAGVSVPSEGGDREAGSVTFGASGDTTSLLGGVSFNSRDIIFQNAFPWVGLGASIFGSNFTSRFNFDFRGIPGACGGENFYIDGSLCRFNFNSTNANEASSDNKSIWVKGSHQINDNWEVYSNASLAQTESFGRYAPAPDSTFFYDNLSVGPDSFNNPSNPNAWFYDANNPNAVAYDAAYAGPQREVDLWHRFAAVGNRDNGVENKITDLLVGMTGSVWGQEIDFGLRRVKNNTTELGNGYLAAATAWGFVDDFNPGYSPDGTVFDPATYYFGYNIQDPFSNPNNVLRGSAVTTSRDSNFNFEEVYASTSFDLMEIGGGTVQAVVGGEYRDEQYSDLYDAQSEAGLVGGSAGNSAGGSRSATALYFETLLPVSDVLELSVAGRYDNYSDYGSDFSPKLSFRYQPMDKLTLRGSYGEGFRAPTLDILTQAPAFSADSVRDPDSCFIFANDPNAECQINATVIANPELESEKSKQFAFGLAFQPYDWLEGTLDYYNIEIDDRIRGFGSQAIIDRSLNPSLGPIPAGLSITRTPVVGNDGNTYNVVTNITRGFVNEGDLATDGIDFNVRANYDLGPGRLTNNFQVSYINDFSIDGGRDLIETQGSPRYRANFTNTYNVSDFQFAYNMNIIGAQCQSLDDQCTSPFDFTGTWITHDVQANYDTPWDGRVTVGVQNIGEKLPQIKDFDSREYNYNLYNGYGRVSYIRYTQTF